MVKCPVDTERARIGALSATAPRRNQCQTVKSVIGQMDGVEIKEKRGAKLRFRMYVTQKMMSMQLEDLELSVRAFHSLKRAGFDYVGDLLDALEQGMDLRRIRNCGVTSIREIQERLFLLQYYSLPEKRRESYLKEVVELNR